MVPADPPVRAGDAGPSFRAALGYWLKLGCVSFGGAAGQIAMMQADLVDRLKWIDQRRYLEALNFCMLLPGPEAQQLATFIGWRLHGLKGALAAGILFIVPGFTVLMLLAWIAAAYGDLRLVQGIFYAVQPTVVAIIAAALYRMGRKTLRGWAPALLAVAAFLALYALDLPFPGVIVAAGLIGWIAPRIGLHSFDPAAPRSDAETHILGALGPGRLARLIGWFVLYLSVPAGLIVAVLGTEPFLDIAILFTTAAFVTFGGAYAVLPYVAEAAVETYAWVTPAQMVQGLALAETTPGPTILVTQFVGFLAGWTPATDGTVAVEPLLAGVAAASLTVYCMFLPGFFFILAGAPVVERLNSNPGIARALAAITAAVVGVMVNLGVFFGGEVLVPDGTPDPIAIGLAIAALVALVRFNLAVHWLVLAAGLLGIGIAAFG